MNKQQWKTRRFESDNKVYTIEGHERVNENEECLLTNDGNKIYRWRKKDMKD